MNANRLPVHVVRDAVVEALAHGPVVLSSPTGSGKSTEVPRWCEGPVLVIEPRRIACRSLAVRVAELEGETLGGAVGYVVRDERVARDDTRIVFATPGMVLRQRPLIERARTIVLDEFHERSLDMDLLLALLLKLDRRRLVVMSATLEGERVARHLGGVHLSAPGRAFPVDIRYLPGAEILPDGKELGARVARAVRNAANDPGDVLVFLPGKAEIEAAAQALRGVDASVVPLHGGLTLDEQRRAFVVTPQRKIILATNVAETSLTIPGIGVVIDTGLVRQTRYHDGRGFLTLGPIALDSAAQRSGRAGRTAPGVCYRLWSESARLQSVTPPEIHRESLVPLILGAAAWDQRVEELPLLDAPKPYAVAAARANLESWNALDRAAGLNDRGRALFELPVQPLHARLLLAARHDRCADDVVDLVAALAIARPLFGPSRAEAGSDDDLLAGGCDATALIRAVRAARPDEYGVVRAAQHEARQVRARLRRLEGLPESTPESHWDRRIDREALIRAALAADARVAYVARARGRDTYFSNGGTEIELGRESAVRNLRDLQALVVLDTRAFGAGRDARVVVTCGLATTQSALARAGLGRDRVAGARCEHKRVVANIERVYAERVISEREEVPTGELARAAFVMLLLRGSLFREAVTITRERLARAQLAADLALRRHPAGLAPSGPIPALDQWLLLRVEALGIESGEDLALLSANDFLAPPLPDEILRALEDEFPEAVSVGDALYRAEYDLKESQVLLRMVKGSRRDPPPLAYLPKFQGLRVCVEGARGMTVLRPRGGR